MTLKNIKLIHPIFEFFFFSDVFMQVKTESVLISLLKQPITPQCLPGCSVWPHLPSSWASLKKIIDVNKLIKTILKNKELGTYVLEIPEGDWMMAHLLRSRKSKECFSLPSVSRCILLCVLVLVSFLSLELGETMTNDLRKYY